MESLLSALLKSETFLAWQQRYRMKHAFTLTEITIEIDPFPPDTVESVYADMVGGEIKRLEKEFADKEIALNIEYEACVLFEDTFRFYVRP